MASNNLTQFLYNADFELQWIVKDGEHTIKLIEHLPNGNPSKMVGESEDRDTFTYTE